MSVMDELGWDDTIPLTHCYTMHVTEYIDEQEHANQFRCGDVGGTGGEEEKEREKFNKFLCLSIWIWNFLIFFPVCLFELNRPYEQRHIGHMCSTH